MIRFKYIAPYNVPPRVLDEVSLTIPDQALSVRQILERYAVGASVDASQHIGSFDNDADFDDFVPTESPDFDLADIQNEREAIDGMRDVRLETGDPSSRETGDPSSRETGDPSSRETGDPSSRETGDPSKKAPIGREKLAT